MSVKEPDFSQSAVRHRTTLNIEPTISLDLITVLTAVLSWNYEELCQSGGTTLQNNLLKFKNLNIYMYV